MQSSRKTMPVSASAFRLPRLPRRYKPSRFRRAVVLGAAVGMMSVGLRLPLRADTFNWLAGPMDTNWENPLNWINSSNMNGVPGVNDDVVNSTNKLIEYLIGAGSSTVSSFTNSGGGAFNINLSDPVAQSFTVNGNISNLTPTSLIDITGVGFNAVAFNNFGGQLFNEGIIRVHDAGSLSSFADDITNSGTMTVDTGALVAITQANGISDTLTNTGTINALSGGSYSVLNAVTINQVNGLLNADGSGSNIGFSSTSFTNNGRIQATNGGVVGIADPSLVLTNNNTIQADGTGAMSAPTVNLNGDTLTNNANGYIQAINGNGATVNVDFVTINNNGVLASSAANTFLNINSNAGSATLTNTFAVSAGNGGLVNDNSQTINNLAYLDGMGNPNNGLGYSAFRNGQLFVNGDVNNAGVFSSVFNNGNVAGTTPGWVHAFSDLNDTDTYIRIDPNVNNYAGSHITAESTQGGAGFQRIDLNVPDSLNESTDLYNAGTIEALTGAQIRSYATTLTNDVGGVIISDGLNAAALALGNRPNSPYASAVYLGDNTKYIGGINNSGTMQATNGGLLSVNATTLANYSDGVITSSGLDAGSGIGSAVILGNYNRNINEIINSGTISAVNGGTTAVNFNTLSNFGSLIADGSGLTGTSIDPVGGGIKSQFSPATLYLNGANNGIPSNALTNTGTIAATNGGRINPDSFNNSLAMGQFTNQGTISADGVGMSSSTVLPNGDIDTFYTPSSIGIWQRSYYTPSQYIGGAFTNAANGVISTTNGADLSIYTEGGSIINNGQITASGIRVDERITFAGGGTATGSEGVVDFLVSLAQEYAYDTTGNRVRGGSFLNTGTMTASDSHTLEIFAQNGITNSGNIIVHGNNDGIRASVTLLSYMYLGNQFQFRIGGNLDLIGGSVFVDTWGNFGAYAAANLTQSAASSITARDNVTTVYLQADGDFANAGLIDMSNQAALTLNVGGILTNSGTIRATSGATLDGTVKGSLNNSGSIQTSGGTFKTNAAGGTFSNSGAITANGGSITAVASTSATNSGTLTAQNGGNITIQNNTVLNNSGTIRAGNASSLTFNGGETQIGASSRTQVDAGGTLTVGSSPGLTLGTGLVAGDGGILAGNGTVIGNVTNLSGTIEPGASPGLLTIQGNYAQGANGNLHIQIEGLNPGTQYDVLNVTNNISLDGLLTLDFDSAFQPFAGGTFDFLRYGGTLSGDFSRIQVLGLNNSLAYSFNVGGGGYNLVITPAGGASVPEPGTVALLLSLSVAGANFLRRKRKMA